MRSVQKQVEAMIRVGELLQKHGEFEWAKYFIDPLPVIRSMTSMRAKRRYLKVIAKNIPSGFGGIRNVYFQENGRVIQKDSRELHDNLDIFFKVLNTF